MRQIRPKYITNQTLLYISVVLVVLFFIFPFLWMILTSLKTSKDLFAIPVSLFPKRGWNFKTYLEIWTKENFAYYFLNSFKVAVLAVALSITTATLAGLGFARYNFKGKNSLMIITLLSQLFPLVLLVMPFFVLWKNWGILDTHLSLILSYTAFSLPYCIWMMTGYFGTIPESLEEAAMIDGSTRLGAYIRITLPLATPGIVATVIYCFILAWNEFLFATTFISSRELQTLTIGLHSFIGQYQISWNLLMAGAVITTLPLVVLFIFLQRFLIRGLTAGSVKS